ncbi:type IX secretion system protein PorQ [Flavobacterium sp. CYK-55]|uniref:type IX secretion system protein PorQ n=1 Tax=Flavobacterium sp. CYK-55 TaxID=2835529 RepID=UPI001BCF3ACD|nr:type IX secretion system protein PorQ [Flavobacterium sp. CYK-55]MBS7787079.1 type IX secretion system protein PorQ [Flavobacterium sp. CYK-55]
MIGRLLFLALFLCGTVGYAQVGGQSVYQFLNMVTSPRQAALGGKTITIYDADVNQGHFNPAAINPDMDNRFAINYGSYYGEVTYGTAAYAYTYDRHVQTLHAGVNYVNYGQFDGYDETGTPTSSFTGSEIALSMGYALNIPSSNWHIGANAKLINSTLESYNSFGAALDIGSIYVDDQNDINWAVVVRNLGTQISTYAGTKEKLPTELMVGVSQKLQNVPLRWHLTLENLQQWEVSFSNPARAKNSIDGSSEPEKVSFFNNALRHVIIGAELFPDRGFNVRVSYNFRRGEELRLLEQRNFSGISVGLGLKMGRLKFDYSYSRYTLAANTSLFGLTIDFNEQ